MKPKELPPVDLLRALFDYDPHTGIITRKQNTRGRHAGEAGCLNKVTGYRLIEIETKVYTASRIAYALHFGVDPYPQLIDHINRNRADNRICNLRVTTKSGNNHNRLFAKSGHWGITEVNNGWQVVIRRKYIGRRKTLEEAIQLRDSVCEREGIDIIV